MVSDKLTPNEETSDSLSSVTRPDPIIAQSAAHGRPVDRLIAGVAALGLVASVATTLWFFLGFAETDPGFAPASSALLLSLLLGAFAIIPCAVIMRLAWRAWRRGFHVSHGLWSLFLILPWIGLALAAAGSDWMPTWLTLVPLLIAIPTGLWAITSIILDRVTTKGDISNGPNAKN